MNNLVAFALMSAVWGFTWLPMKLASEAVPPIFLAAVRFLIASALFFAFLRLKGITLAVSSVGRLVTSALFITTGCYAFVFWGVAHAPTGISAIVNLSLMPIFIAIIAALYGQETITARRVAAIALGIAGLVFLFWSRTGAATGGSLAGWGLVSIAVGTLCYAWGSVMSRPLVGAMEPTALAFWQTLIGGIALVPVSLAIEGWEPGRIAALGDWRALLGLFVLVGGGSLVAFSIYLRLVRDWGAFRAALYSFVSPAVAVAVGVLLAGEPFGWPEAIGMAVMLTATALVMTEPRGAISAS